MKRSKIPKLLTLTAMFFLLITVIVGLGNVYASSSFLTTFNNTYGTSGTVLNTCVLCHINPAGGGTRNPYGTDFANASIGNHTFNAALEAGIRTVTLTQTSPRLRPGHSQGMPPVIRQEHPLLLPLQLPIRPCRR